MELHTLWVGPRLGWLEKLCLTSMLTHGHEVVLWTYQAIKNVPAGIRLAPADRILPDSAIIRHRATNSLALFANRFRYRLLRTQPVTWVDVDMLFLRQLTDASPILFGLEDTSSVCNAILRLPPDNAALRDVEQLSLQRVPLPFWWSRRRRWRQRLAGLVGRHVRPEDMTWGTFGPKALTEAALRHGMMHLARAPDLFYPVHYSEASVIFGPSFEVERRITASTIAVHLWGESNQSEKRKSPPPHDSWIAAMCRRLDIVPAVEGA
jgi:hypothetical protein